MKIGYFIKENKMKTSTLNQHGIPEQNSAETSKNKPHGAEQEMDKIAHHNLTLTHDDSTPKTVQE